MTFKNIYNSTGDLNYPKVLPTLDLNFANSKTLDPRITFTRSSGGGYIGPDGLIKYAGVNQPRFDHDPITGESLGLLIGEQRTNLLTYSEQIDNAVWIKSGISVRTNQLASPDGTTSADAYVETTGIFEIHATSQSFSITSGVIYTGSVYIKPIQRRYCILAFTPDNRWTTSSGGTGTAKATFDLQNGTILSTINCTASIQALLNGWYRCTFTATAAVTSTGSFFIGSSLDGVALTYTGNGSLPFYIWGAQVEIGTFPTSYIPTIASQRTRNVDNVSMTGVNFNSWYNRNEGTMYSDVSININRTLPLDRGPGIWSLDNGSFGNGYGVYVSPFGVSRTVFILRVSTQVIPTSASVNIADQKKIKNCSFILPSVKNEVTTCTNAIFSDRTSSFNSSLTMSRLLIGSNNITGISGNITNYLNGTIKRLTYYPRRLSTSQIQTLTK